MIRRARFTDPVTSHEAAASDHIDGQSKTQLSILAILGFGPATDTEIIRVYQDLYEFGDVPRASESGIRSRRSELVAMGKVEPSGEYRTTESGRKSIVWQVVR